MKHIIDMLLAIFNINAAINANRVIFYLKRIPVIGKMIPDRIYAASDLKLIATVVVTILNILRKLVGKALYIGLMFVMPLFLIFKGIPRADYPDAFAHLFFFLSILAGTIQISVLLEANRNKYLCIKMMRFQARDFVIPSLFARHMADFLFFVPAVAIAFVIIGGNVLQAFLIVLSMTAFRFSAEAFQLLLYDKKAFLLNKKYVLQWAVIIPSCVAAYLPLYYGKIWPVKILFSFPAAAVLIAGAVFAIRYILRFSEYKRVVEASLKLDDIMLDMNKLKREALFSGVKMKEGEFSEASLQSKKFENKQGYEYLNAIFFERHRKLLERPIIQRLCVIAGTLAIALTATLLFPQILDVFNNKLLSIMPLFVFVMYSISLGDRICKAMFYNCDISLLRYSFYRNKDVILRNFTVRLRKVTVLNLIVGIAICAALYLFVAITGISFQRIDLLLFTVSILCLAVFFSVHHLFLYYVFQPYTTELGMKNPFFRLINTIVYLFCFGCLQLKNVPGYFTLIIIGATLTYIFAALISVYRLAPQYFRVK